MTANLPADLGDTLRGYRDRIAVIEASDGSAPWVYVCVDSTDPNWTPISPLFIAPWMNTGPPQAPVSFKRFLNWVHIRGGFTNGSVNDPIFVLPVEFRPAYFQPMVIPTGDGLSVSTIGVDIDGTVTLLS